ncbi:diguanylate cyclase regulator RdcB family protein [Shigella flexneri]
MRCAASSGEWSVTQRWQNVARGMPRLCSATNGRTRWLRRILHRPCSPIEPAGE